MTKPVATKKLSTYTKTSYWSITYFLKSEFVIQRVPLNFYKIEEVAVFITGMLRHLKSQISEMYFKIECPFVVLIELLQIPHGSSIQSHERQTSKDKNVNTQKPSGHVRGTSSQPSSARLINLVI